MCLDSNPDAYLKFKAHEQMGVQYHCRPIFFYDKALGCYLKAIETKDDYVEFCKINENLRLYPTERSAKNDLGSVYARISKILVDQGRKEDAIKYLQYLVTLLPEADWAYESIGDILLSIGQAQGALNAGQSHHK